MPREDYFTYEEGRKILEKNCRDSLKPSEIDFAHFTFRDPVQALTFAAYTNSFIPINESIGFKPVETGGINGGDIPHQFHRNFVLIRDLYKTGWIWDSLKEALSHPLYQILSEFEDYLSTEKHLVFVEKHSLSRAIKSIIGRGYNPSDFVMYVSDNILGEDFYNYPVIEYLKDEGYFVGFWTPKAGSDLVAVRIPEYQEQLEERGFIRGGASFFELELVPFRGFEKSESSKKHHSLDRYDVIYMEVEARINLALRGSHAGVGQKSGLASSRSEVYGVGPVSDIAAYLPKPGERFGDRYKASCEHFNRLGAIMFDRDGKMKVVHSDERGFDEEDETISDYKIFLKLTLLNRLSIKRIKELVGAKGLDEFVRKIYEIDFSVILTQLLI